MYLIKIGYVCLFETIVKIQRKDIAGLSDYKNNILCQQNN